MKTLKDSEALLNQGIEFYFKCCSQSSIIPEQPDSTKSAVTNRSIRLYNINGLIAKISYSEAFIFFELNGVLFSEEVK